MFSSSSISHIIIHWHGLHQSSHRMQCPCLQPSLRVYKETQSPSVPLGWMCRQSCLCCGAECPTPSCRWRRPVWVRGMAGWCSVWSPCRWWVFIYQRRTGDALLIHCFPHAMTGKFVFLGMWPFTEIKPLKCSFGSNASWLEWRS